MVTSMKFGKCLRSLLSILDISIVRLSKVINVDSSLVNRWVNDKRVPPYNTNYIENIADYLSNSILNTYQEQYLDDFFLDVCGEKKEELNAKDKITKILLQSQGYSMECNKSVIKEKNNRIKNHNNVSQLIYDPHNKFYDNTSKDSLFSDTSLSLSSEDKIILGYKNIVNACISLLEKSSHHEPNHKKNSIYISLNNCIYQPDYHLELANLKNNMLKAMDNGWNILFSIQLNNTINETARFVEFIRSLVNNGNFFPFYFKKYDMITTCSEFVIIPEIGSLLIFSNSINSSAFLFKNSIAINILKNKYDHIITNYTKPLVKYFSINNSSDYSNYLTEAEEVIGNRILYKQDFGLLLIPEELYKKLLLKKNLSLVDVNASLDYYKRRLLAFTNNVRNYTYTDIYHSYCINNLIKQKKLRLYMYNMIEEIHLETEEVILLLENIIRLLTEYENYKIALIPQDSHNSALEYVIYCMLKERNAVLIETYQHYTNLPKVRLSIEEPILVKVVETYLKEVIDQIAPINKDKNEIITWIQHSINSFRMIDSPQ